MNWFNLFKKKQRFPGIEYAIKEAFTVKGRTFYEMDELINQPFERAVICLRYYEEFNQRVTRDYLLEHTKAIAELCKLHPGKPIELSTIERLNNNLSDRLHWIIDADLAYKLASVVFFDKDENPAKYDFKYNADKIEFWKANMPAKDFFFMQPLKKLIPFLDGYEENLETYIQVTESLKSRYQEEVLKHISKN